MIEITASDIFWIGAMDKIEIGLIVMFLFALFLVFMAVDSSSVAIFLFALLLGIFSMTAWVFIPSSKTLAAMKVLPAIVNNLRQIIKRPQKQRNKNENQQSRLS